MTPPPSFNVSFQILVDLLDRESLGIPLFAHPLKKLLGPVLQFTVKPVDASNIVRRTGPLTARANRICHARVGRQTLLEDDGVFPIAAMAYAGPCGEGGL
jgi:hypothetical protein